MRTKKVYLKRILAAVTAFLVCFGTGGSVREVAASSQNASNYTETLKDSGVVISHEGNGGGRGVVTKIPSSVSGKLELPKGVYSIAGDAAEGGSNSKITTLVLPETFESKSFQGDGDVRDALDQFTGLENIVVSGDNQNFATKDGVLYSADHKTLVEYPAGRDKIEAGDISDEATRIGEAAFSNMSISDFQIPASIKNYDAHPFYKLTGTDQIILPSSPDFLGSNTFEYTGFTNITIPANTSGKKISDHWLITDQDTTVTIPESITQIDEDAIVVEGKGKVTVRGVSGSPAEQYVKDKKSSKIVFAQASSYDTVSGNSAKGVKAEIDNKSTMADKGKAAATVKGSESDYKLIIKDSAGNKLKKLVPSNADTTMVAYDLSLVDSSGKAASFDSVSITLPVPAGMDRTKGSIDVVTINDSGSLEPLRTSVTGSGNGAVLTFTTTHFSEYAIRYVEDDTASDSGATSAASASTSGSDADMPKTGVIDDYPMIMVVLLALGGMILIVASTSVLNRRKK